MCLFFFAFCLGSLKIFASAFIHGSKSRSYSWYLFQFLSLSCSYLVYQVLILMLFVLCNIFFFLLVFLGVLVDGFLLFCCNLMVWVLCEVKWIWVFVILLFGIGLFIEFLCVCVWWVWWDHLTLLGFVCKVCFLICLVGRVRCNLYWDLGSGYCKGTGIVASFGWFLIIYELLLTFLFSFQFIWIFFCRSRWSNNWYLW